MVRAWQYDKTSQPFIYKLYTIECLIFKYSARAMQKHAIGRIRTIWSGPCLSANRIIGYYRMYEWRAKARMILCIWSESVHFARVPFRLTRLNIIPDRKCTVYKINGNGQTLVGMLHLQSREGWREAVNNDYSDEAMTICKHLLFAFCTRFCCFIVAQILILYCVALHSTVSWWT